jgi:hypothetical protein
LYCIWKLRLLATQIIHHNCSKHILSKVTKWNTKNEASNIFIFHIQMDAIQLFNIKSGWIAYHLKVTRTVYAIHNSKLFKTYSKQIYKVKYKKWSIKYFYLPYSNGRASTFQHKKWTNCISFESYVYWLLKSSIIIVQNIF